MQFSLGLPWGARWGDGTPVTGEDLRALAGTAESAGYSAVFATDHPAPPRRWLESGGHPTLDPFAALSYVASATQSILLHTHLLVAPYRHPLLVAKSIASLVALSGRRVIVGMGAGYLRGEFAALDIDFERRNELADDAIVTIRRALKGEEVNGGVVRPLPSADPRPPIWIGGNSRRAIERAVDLAQGWCPMPSPASAANAVKTPGIESVSDLQARITYARERCEAIGRTEPLTICFSPWWGAMPADSLPEPARALDELSRLSQLGVSWVPVTLPGDSRAELSANIDAFAAEVIGAANGEEDR